MIKLENIEVMNFEGAMRGMRNPLESWHKSDSYYYPEVENGKVVYILGKNDLDLAKRLCKAGTDHRKFLRQILVSMDITAPLYWWKEQSTYKVGTCENSTSTMHKIHAKEFVLNDFSHEKMVCEAKRVLAENIIPELNGLRDVFNETKDKDVWYSMIQLLPSSYNQTRTCTLNYEVLRNMYHSRKNHKLDEWRDFCKAIEEMPYAKELIVGE